MSESDEEWPEYMCEKRHAHRIKRLEDKLFIPTILIHIANILFLKETKWIDTDISSNSPHAPRSAVPIPLNGPDALFSVISVYMIYIFVGGVALVCWLLSRLFSPTLDDGISSEAISIMRCRNVAIVTIPIMFIVLPALYKVHPRWSVLLLTFLIYKCYVSMALSNYLKILKEQGTYFSSPEHSYPIDRPMQQDLLLYINEIDSYSGHEYPSDCDALNSDRQQRDSNFSNITPPNYREVIGESRISAYEIPSDQPPTYEEATRSVPISKQ